MRAMPFDTPLPYDISLAAAGRGPSCRITRSGRRRCLLPTSPRSSASPAGSPRWILTQEAPAEPEFATTLARLGPDGYMTHFARISISGAKAGQTVVTFDFTPIPSSLAPE